MNRSILHKEKNWQKLHNMVWKTLKDNVPLLIMFRNYTNELNAINMEVKAMKKHSP